MIYVFFDCARCEVKFGSWLVNDHGGKFDDCLLGVLASHYPEAAEDFIEHFLFCFEHLGKFLACEFGGDDNGCSLFGDPEARCRGFGYELEYPARCRCRR